MLCEAIGNTSVDFCHVIIHQVDYNLCWLHLSVPLLKSLEPRRVHQEGVVKHVELVTEAKCEYLKNEQNISRS